MTRVLCVACVAVCLALPRPASAAINVDLFTLKVMHDKGLLSDAEYASAMQDMQDTAGAKAADAETLVVGKFSTTVYGFVETDFIHDSSEAFVDLQGNNLINPSASAYQQTHGRTQFSVRNSRLGFRLKAPEYGRMRLSGTIELDLLGTELPIGYGQPYYESESSWYTNPAMRVRHAYVKFETPIVDVLAGQTWDVFGMQPFFHPNSVEIQGLPGQLYSRTPQLRISKTVKTNAITLDVVLAAMRPPQRDSEVPEGQGGVRLAINGWTGAQTMGATGTTVSPLSIGLSGDTKYLSVPNYSGKPTSSVSKSSVAFAADAFIPVLPAKDPTNLGNSLSINGEFVNGYGTNDLYTQLSGGISIPALPAPATYPQDLDNGIATFDPSGNLQFVQWTSYLFGAQYYFPGVNGKVWLSANYSHLSSLNTPNLVAASSAAKVLQASNWGDVNLFVDPVPGFRVGLEGSRTLQTYGDGSIGNNTRLMLSAFLIF